MSDHSTLPQRLSKVTGDQLVALLARPSLEEDALLRAYFGPETYRRLRSLALRCQIIRHEAGSLPDEKPRSHVVIVPGMLGSELSSVDDGLRTDVLAPTFAESFFARGVVNFICTAWPVNDRSARHFALALYASLLGLSYEPRSGLATNLRTDQQRAPEAMHVAMREARRAIIEHDNRTWGAYQHYGNPNARLFAKLAETTEAKSTS